MKLQEIFNRVSRHLLQQNQKSVSPGTSICLYRGPGNRSCAVGCLIPDHLYDVSMETKQVADVLVDFPDLLKFVGGHLSLRLLTALQQVHDGHDPKSWAVCLQNVARDFNLDWTPVADLQGLR